MLLCIIIDTIGSADFGARLERLCSNLFSRRRRRRPLIVCDCRCVIVSSRGHPFGEQAHWPASASFFALALAPNCALAGGGSETVALVVLVVLVLV